MIFLDAGYHKQIGGPVEITWTTGQNREKIWVFRGSPLMSAEKESKMATYNDNESYTSKGVGNAGLTLGIIGTTLASGVLGGGSLGGIFGNNNPTASAAYQLSTKDTEIAQLKAERYADGAVRALSMEVSDLKSRVAAIEVAEPLREQILMQQIGCVQNTLNRLVQPMIPNANVAPGWGQAFVSPFPPSIPTVQGGTVATPTSTTSNG